MPLADSLKALAQTLKIVQVAHTPFGIKVQLPAPADGLKVSELVTSTEILQGPLDLTWRTKDVRFATRDITDPAVVGGMPIPALLTLNIGSVTSGPLTPPGVPGTIGTVVGNLPIPSTVTEPTLTPVTANVRYRILDEQGVPVANAAWTLAVPGQPVSGVGGDVDAALAPFAELDIKFPPIIVELTTSPPLPVRRTIQASVNLSTATPSASSGWIDLPPVQLDLIPIAIPTIFLLYENVGFTGRMLIVVPSNSPLTEAGLSAELNQLSTAISALANNAAFSLTLMTAMLGTGDPSGRSIPDQLAAFRRIFVKADAIANLDDHVYDGGFLGIGRVTAEDLMSAVMFIGPPGRQAQCFIRRDFDSGNGQFNVTVSGSTLAATATNIHSASPASDPAGSVTVVTPPSGFRPFHFISIFGDELSSVKFN
ncbi:MAG: hypothetical protein ACJ79H_15100 [Myxococcales bacterium]